MDGTTRKNKAFAQGKRKQELFDSKNRIIRYIYEIQACPDTSGAPVFGTGRAPYYHFGLAHNLCIAGLIAMNYHSRQPIVYHPKIGGKEVIRVADLQENFKGLRYMDALPTDPIVYETYIPANEGLGFDGKTRFSIAAPGDYDTYINHNDTFGIVHNDLAYPAGLHSCLDPRWSLPETLYKLRDPQLIGYHFASTDPTKTISSRYKEKFIAKNSDTYDFNRFDGKLDKTIRQMSKCKEFHGTLGGMSFLAMAMRIPTTIHINKRFDTKGPIAKIYKVLAKRHGATFVEADI